jgi:hypothetical protein
MGENEIKYRNEVDTALNASDPAGIIATRSCRTLIGSGIGNAFELPNIFRQ